MKIHYQSVIGGRLKFTLTLRRAEFHLLLVHISHYPPQAQTLSFVYLQINNPSLFSTIESYISEFVSKLTSLIFITQFRSMRTAQSSLGLPTYLHTHRFHHVYILLKKDKLWEIKQRILSEPEVIHVLVIHSNWRIFLFYLFALFSISLAL